MNELSKELNQRIEEASKDAAWLEKLSAASAWEEYAALLGEKGIEAPAELKDAFDAKHSSKTGKLEDDELDKVSGGWTPIFNCPQVYNAFLCEYTFCPHLREHGIKVRDSYTAVPYCDLGFWDQLQDIKDGNSQIL